jgi:hypothetical protein
MKLSEARTRDDAWSILDGFSFEGRESLELQRSRKPLIKSYILETTPDDRPDPNLSVIFNSQHVTLTQLDDTLFRIDNEQHPDSLGFLEIFPRHPVIYTPLETKHMDPWVKKLTRETKDLDSLWLSGQAFQTFLEDIYVTASPHRYGRLVFEHRSIFELEQSAQVSVASNDTETDEPLLADEQVDSKETENDDEEENYQETRSTKFSVMDRLQHLQEKLNKLQGIYDPLYSISQLRFPAAGRGGHDFYHWGKVTNRSDSFQDHRQHVEYVLNTYRASTTAAERCVWSFEEKHALRTQGKTQSLIGAPVFFKFSKPLSVEVFETFITRVFIRGAKEFRLWGNPIKLGSRKVHVYGLDRHLWQPIHLEITHEGIVAIVPHGTCGNSIHRLVTNIQQYLDPRVAVYIGDKPYQSFLRSVNGKESNL